MFRIGDIIRARLDVAEEVYEGCRGTTVYKKMMHLAKTKRYEIIGDAGSAYVIKHLYTDPLIESTHDKSEVHEYFILDEELTKQNNEEESDG